MAKVLLLLLLFVDARVAFDHNPNSTATREFKFKNIASLYLTAVTEAASTLRASAM